MASNQKHSHRCMRCGETFECLSPGVCEAGTEVLPRIVLSGSHVVDHCPNTPRGRLRYKGYRGIAAYNSETNGYNGTVEHIRDVVTFEADTLEGLPAAFQESVDDYLAMCAERGEEPNAPVTEGGKADAAD